MLQEQIDHSKNLVSGVFFAESIQNPENLLNSIIFSLMEKYPTLINGFFLFTYELEEPWNEKRQGLKVCYQVTLDYHNRKYFIASFTVESVENLRLPFSSKKNRVETFYKNTITGNFDFQFFKQIQSEYSKKKKHKISLKPNEMLFFEPIYIPKPWGQEIWYTGVEKRGVSKIKSFYQPENSLPLNWIFSALPNKLLGKTQSEKNLILVKILDPLPDEVLGDLYYELHTEKNEVYVVTEISTSVGKIKFGVSVEKRKALSNNDEEYKKQFLVTIKNYENIRRKIDSLFDAIRLENNIPLNDPVPANKIKEWMTKIPSELLLEEKEKRVEMDSFAGYINLNIGDVIRVPILVPHALQHGVRVIEFQTPTYERLIISFAQKVLTQNRWDTDKAFEMIHLLPPQKTELEILNENEDFCEELVCSFSDFKSSRFKVKENKELTLKSQEQYQLFFHVEGTLYISVELNHFKEVVPGSCLFLPAGVSLQLKSQSNVTYLICTPR